MILLDDTRQAIRESARKLLVDCAIGEPPTSLDALLKHLGLTIRSFRNLNRHQRLAVRQVAARDPKAAIYVPGKTIYLHPDLRPTQKNFATAHEIGHYVLDWHHAVFQVCSLIDLTLDARKKMELEASQFGAEIVFQLDRFTKDAAFLPFGVSSVLTLADTYSASYEASARRYVEGSTQPCLLIVWQPIETNGRAGNGDLLEVQYYVASPSCTIRAVPRSKLSSEHAIARLYSGEVEEEILIQDELVELRQTGTQMKLRMESFSNSYKVLTLASPLT